jgi:hypothetical protein
LYKKGESVKKINIIIMLWFVAASICCGYVYDLNDFAVEVVSPNGYVEGTGVWKDWINEEFFNNPEMALGRPTVDTTGDNNIDGVPAAITVPVNPVYPPFRSYELVSIGDGGSLTLKFSHPVADDINNPYGIDFIVFTNFQKEIGADEIWDNSDPAQCIVTNSGVLTEGGLVSVSHDGIRWYTYENGPEAESFAPTLGRVYDPENPDTSIGLWNQWWGEPTDPTLPLDPAITASDMVNKNLAEIAMMYGKSAGGNGYDLAESGLAWIQYIRIEANGGGPDIDAVADVSACGDYKHPFPDGDVNKDCTVDMADFAMMAGNWLKCTWQCE